jgi:hypothetical protein
MGSIMSGGEDIGGVKVLGFPSSWSAAWSGSGDYRMEADEDVLTLRRQDGSPVGRFSARGAKRRCVLRVIEDDCQGYPQYSGSEKHAESVRRYVRVRMESPWERFLNTEWRTLEARRKGQLAKALLRALPRESQQEIDRMTLEDRRRAEELVELRSEEGALSYKPLEQLVAEDRHDRMRAELRRLEWLLERQKRPTYSNVRAFSSPDRRETIPRTTSTLFAEVSGRSGLGTLPPGPYAAGGFRVLRSHLWVALSGIRVEYYAACLARALGLVHRQVRLVRSRSLIPTRRPSPRPRANSLRGPRVFP